MIAEAVMALVPESGRRSCGARLEDDRAAKFVLAGNARFTLASARTGARFTYRVRAKEVPAGARPIWFVSVLTGPDNASDYEFLGTIFAPIPVKDRQGPSSNFHEFVHGKKSRIGRGAPSAVAFGWFWPRAARGIAIAGCEVWHLGKCGRCGRDLTVPESVAMGLGPECASR